MGFYKFSFFCDLFIDKFHKHQIFKYFHLHNIKGDKMEYLETIAQQIGIPLWSLILILIWSIAWKLPALWKSARKGSIIWFIILVIFNTIGILPILYIFAFSKMKCCKLKSKKIKKPLKKKSKKKK